jgi:hypothetical protein
VEVHLPNGLNGHGALPLYTNTADECELCSKSDESGVVVENNNGDSELTFKASPPLLPDTPVSLISNLSAPVEFECVCNAPRLASEFEFMKSLVSIGKKLIRLASKELKSKCGRVLIRFI